MLEASKPTQHPQDKKVRIQTFVRYKGSGMKNVLHKIMCRFLKS